MVAVEGSCLRISDTGIGIAPEDLPRVFERGFTGYNGRREQRSSGIGLYLCRRILDRLGHTITIASVPGEGTPVRIGLDSRKMRVEESDKTVRFRGRIVSQRYGIPAPGTIQ